MTYIRGDIERPITPSTPREFLTLFAGRGLSTLRPSIWGGDLPLIEFWAESPQLLHAWPPYRNRLGAKSSFYHQYLEGFLAQALEGYCRPGQGGRGVGEKVPGGQLFLDGEERSGVWAALPQANGANAALSIPRAPPKH